MATPTVTVQRAVQKPGDETTHEATGVTTQYRVTLVLGGTTANIQTDWATLIGTNFASPSAVISWDKAS
jgi:hypothetical protein